MSNPSFDYSYTTEASEAGPETPQDARLPLATLRPLRHIRSPPNKARLSVESNTNVLGSGDRLRVSALPLRTRLSVPDESFLFFVDDTNETTVLSGTAHDTSVLANGDTSESFIFKAMPASELKSQRRWSSFDGGNTYRAFNDGVDDHDMMNGAVGSASITTPTDSGYTGSTASLHSRLPLHPMEFEDVDIGVGSYAAQRPRTPPFFGRHKTNAWSRQEHNKNASTTYLGIRGIDNERYRWTSRLEFIVALFCLMQCSPADLKRLETHYSDDISGGFLVAYLLALVIIVYPLLYVQCTLGQYWTQGPLALWRVLPLCYGIGIVTTILSLLEVLVLGNQSGIHFVRVTTVLQDTCSRTSGSLSYGRGEATSCQATHRSNSEYGFIEWPLALALTGVWGVVFALTCYRPTKIVVNALKLTMVVPLLTYLIFMVKSLSVNLTSMSNKQTLIDFGPLCDWGTYVRSIEAAIRLTFASNLVVVTLSSLNRFNQPFQWDIALALGLHYVTLLISVAAPGRDSVMLSPWWQTLAPISIALCALNKLLVLSECLIVNSEDVKPIFRRFRPITSMALTTFGLLSTLFTAANMAWFDLGKIITAFISHAGPCLLLMLTICLTCLYKIDNFNENVISILGAKPSLLSSLHLWLINPTLLAVVVGLSIFTPYQSFVWWLILLLLTTVPIVALFIFIWTWSQNKSFRALKELLSPNWNRGKINNNVVIRQQTSSDESPNI